MPARAPTFAARLADWPAESSLGRYAAPKRAIGVAEFSLRSVSAESRQAAPGACVGSVGSLRCIALLRAAGAWCVHRQGRRSMVIRVVAPASGVLPWWTSPRAELLVMKMVLLILELMIILLKAHILFRCRWATCGPVGGGTEVEGAGWLAPVLAGRELQCMNTACARYAVSVDQGVCLSVRLWSKQGVCLSVWLWEVPTWLFYKMHFVSIYSVVCIDRIFFAHTCMHTQNLPFGTNCCCYLSIPFTLTPYHLWYINKNNIFSFQIFWYIYDANNVIIFYKQWFTSPP
jgi:hypothetical protein